MLYLGFILFCMAAIAGVNVAFAAPDKGFDAWSIVIAVVLSVVAVVIIDGIFATVARWLLPKKWFTADKTRFAASKKKCRFYEKIGIKKWKDLVPELGHLTGFRKNKIADPTNNEYVDRFIEEANFGVCGHALGMIFGFLLVFIEFAYAGYFLRIGLFVAVVNAFINFLSYAILRYNLSKLHTLKRINDKRQKRKAAEDVKNEEAAVTE
ncbi:MAG: hypothetical protein IK147_05325 [Clostridia bacterium]|nr:hypothetical protein [Clostridia bacterium]